MARSPKDWGAYPQEYRQILNAVSLGKEVSAEYETRNRAASSRIHFYKFLKAIRLNHDSAALRHEAANVGAYLTELPDGRCRLTIASKQSNNPLAVAARQLSTFPSAERAGVAGVAGESQSDPAAEAARRYDGMLDEETIKKLLTVDPSDGR